VILRAAHWLSHVYYDLEGLWRPWLQARALPLANFSHLMSGLRLDIRPSCDN
jgi:hypothetical protein